jgi:transposase-like protein
MTSDTASSGPATRRRYSAEVKAQVMAECDAPGASVAKVAMAHGINANVVHRWRQQARESGSVVPASPASSCRCRSPQSRSLSSSTFREDPRCNTDLRRPAQCRSSRRPGTRGPAAARLMFAMTSFAASPQRVHRHLRAAPLDMNRWQRFAREGRAVLPARTVEFVSVSLAPTPVSPVAGDIQIQLRRGATAMTITWPVSASADFAAWTREILK